MRRGVLAFLGTAIGVVLMVAAKLGHPAAGSDEMTVDAAAATGEVATDGSAPPTIIVSGTPVPLTKSGTPRPTAKPTASAVGGSRPPASRAPGSSPTAGAPKPSPAPGGQYKDGTYSGPGVSEKYGTIKVTISVSGGKITNASATCTNPCSGESSSISNNAFGKLNPRVLTAQSASVSTVSGATYTSNAYKTSLASAVNAAKA